MSLPAGRAFVSFVGVKGAHQAEIAAHLERKRSHRETALNGAYANAV
jgi:hypothetical protein